MCVRSAEVLAMSCSLDYSHCPLKKRPVHLPEDVVNRPVAGDLNDSPEPENLSTKPEDLQKTCNKIVSSIKVNPICFSSEHDVRSSSYLLIASVTHHKKYQPSTQPSLNQCNRFENASEDYSINLNANGFTYCYRPTYHSSVTKFETHYPYHSNHHRTVNENLSGYCSPSKRPTDHLLKVKRLHFWKPYLSPYTNLHKPCEAFDSKELSQTSPTLPKLLGLFQTSSSPPNSPEELHSPGSVTSSEGSSIGCSSYTNETKSNVKNMSRYKCSFCPKTYSTHLKLLKHQDLHFVLNEESADKKMFACKSCDKVYVTLGALKLHIRTHTLPCKCVICGKAFSRPWLLQGHIRTHTGEKPFSCPLCERAFADRSNLRAHLQTHSEVKKYSCASCGKTFSRMSLLTKHQDIGRSTDSKRF